MQADNKRIKRREKRKSKTQDQFTTLAPSKLQTAPRSTYYS